MPSVKFFAKLCTSKVVVTSFHEVSYKLILKSQSPGSSRANPMLEGQEIWQHTFKLKV